MRRNGLSKAFGLFPILFLCLTNSFAQDKNVSQPKTQEASDDSIPVIVKHLPDWKNARTRAVYITNNDQLRQALGERPVLELVSFEGGAEAVTANYDAGKLLIVEYSTPQFSIDADSAFKQNLSENPPVPPVYFRRVGNYEVFVFDAADETAANALIDQVKYEKTVQWLGEDPFLLRRVERAYLKTTSDVFVSTIISIVIGLAFAICTGIAVGMFVFYLRRKNRASISAFSDAGGMIRLNLDELTPEVSADRLLEE